MSKSVKQNISKKKCMNTCQLPTTINIKHFIKKTFNLIVKKFLAKYVLYIT